MAITTNSIVGSNTAAAVYNRLPQDERGTHDKINQIYYKKEFYRKEPVNYTCWKVEDSF